MTTWVVVGCRSMERLKVEIEDLQLEESENCGKDYLYVCAFIMPGG